MKQFAQSFLIILFTASISFAGTILKQELLIYSYTEKSTDYTCDTNDEWQKSAVTKTGFVVMQMTASTTIELWYVNTFRAPDTNGKMQKYARPMLPLAYAIDYAEFDTKDTWIVNFSSANEHTFLKGDEKHIFIRAVDKYANIPTLLTGSKTWYYKGADNITHSGSSSLSMRFHSKFTNDYYSDPDLLDAMYAIEGVIGPYLIDNGYIIIPLIIN